MAWKQYTGWRLRRHYMWLGVIDIISGVISIVTLGSGYDFSIKYLLWTFREDK